MQLLCMREGSTGRNNWNTHVQTAKVQADRGMLMMCLVTSTGTRIHPKHKIPFIVNGWCIWNSTKDGFNWSNTVANSQQSTIIQSPLLLIILFQEAQAARSRHMEKNKTMKRCVPGRERQSKAEERLCPSNCCYLWCPLLFLTTLIIVLFVFTLCSPTSFFFFVADNFSQTSTIFPVILISALLFIKQTHTYTHTHTLTLQPSHVITP